MGLKKFLLGTIMYGLNLLNLGRINQEIPTGPKQQRDFLSEPQLNGDDIFLVSYPRSGNTWVRVIIANVLNNGRDIKSLADLNTLVPDIHVGVPEKGYLTPRVIKTHRVYPVRHERNKPELYKRNIYIVRNPFDVIKSYYSYLSNLSEGMDDDYEKFVFDIVHGMIAPCSWSEHVLSWYAASKYNETLFIKYEDLQDNTFEGIQQVAAFLGKELSREQIELVKEKSSLTTMKTMEETGSLVSNKYEFVRSGEKRKINKVLSKKMEKLVRERSMASMEIFGYL
jgi:estrone sulfotransferase